MTNDLKQMSNNLQRSNRELALAYDATIESWVRVLELRDKGTADHTWRVTEVALRLARAVGISNGELVHIRRGALLHDIGKLGIPDAILLKPAALTTEEWVLMRQHPTYGYRLLSPIAFLQPALDIVYCHHERWDGTGYPRGLRGQEIPQAARLFSVVNVWDSLITDQPYRRGWSRDAALTYIGDQAGKQFDPQTVKAFLEVMHD